MAHIRNEEFYLYTGLNATAEQSYQALMHMKSLVGFPLRSVHYGDPAQHPDALAPIKTWKPGLENLDFPFVTYMKVYQLGDPTPRQAEVVVGLAAIVATDWASLAALGA